MSENDWQNAVRTLLADAALVVINIGATAGLSWEVRLALRQLPPERILLFVPPRYRRPPLVPLFGRRSGARRRYESFANEFEEYFPQPLPSWAEVPRDSLFLAFDDHWNLNPVPGVRRWWRSSGEYARYNVAKSLKPFVMAYLAKARAPDAK